MCYFGKMFPGIYFSEIALIRVVVSKKQQEQGASTFKERVPDTGASPRQLTRMGCRGS
jgi:hypothetical protein